MIMDDTLALILGLVVCTVTGLFIRHLIVSHKRELEKRQMEAIEEQNERIRLERKERRDRLQQQTLARLNAPPPKKRMFEKRDESVPPRGKETTVTYAPSPTQSVQSNDGFVDGMLTGMLVDNLINSMTHKSGGSNPIDFPREERSVGVSKSESSWGFDDSDSRKSVSSSMDTSSSYSSSSSDSSSSWSSSDSSSSVSSDW
jgi:hypothetical protein